MARIVAALLLLSLPGWTADKVGDGGWDRARWGMSGAKLQAAYGNQLKTLPNPMQFAQAYAALALPNHELVGSRFTAFFQMDRATGRLGQVLIERRRHYATIALFRRIEAEMIARHGQPCRRRDAPGEPADHAMAVLERSWVMPGGAIHLTFLDFRNDIPKRLVVRYHGRGRPDLMAARAPMASPGTDDGIDTCPAS